MIKKVRRKILNLYQQDKAIKQPLSLNGHVELKKNDFELISSNLKPRVLVEDRAYSMSHDINFSQIPTCVLEKILLNWDEIEIALGAEGILRSCHLYRNIHIPKKDRKKEVFSDAWHRDTIGVTNVQMFILLHNTTKENGPFRYIRSEDMLKVLEIYPNLKNPKRRSIHTKIDQNYVSYFVGSRGDFLLISTFTNFHSATIPILGHKRDMVSIAFEPKKLTSWNNTLSKKDIQYMINKK